MDTVELLIHPARLRVVYALAGGRALTSAELQARIPNVPKATLYRHIALLAEHGILEVVGERRVRGAVERTFRLCEDRTRVSLDDASRMSVDDHRRGFSASMAALLAEFNAYLDTPDAAPVRDAVGYRHFTLWLTDEEKREAIADMQALLVERARQSPAPGRRAHLLSTIFFPLARGEEPAT